MQKQNNLTEPKLVLMSDGLQHFFSEFRFSIDLYGIMFFFCIRHWGQQYGDSIINDLHKKLRERRYQHMSEVSKQKDLSKYET